MLKFVSTKPPKGKLSVDGVMETPKTHKTRGPFRFKYFSKGKGKEDSMDSDGNESGHDGDSAMEDEGEGHYDNISKYKGKTSYVSGEGSLDRKDLKRSHSHSSSSNVDSPKGSLLRRTRSNEMKDPKRQGVFRHVTWGPDVMDGDVFENVEAKTVNGQEMTRSHGDIKPKEQSYYVMGSAKHRTSESQSVNPSKPSYVGSGPYYITSQPYVTSQPYHSTSQPYHATSQPYQAKSEPNHVTSQSYHLSSQPYQVKSEPNHITSQPYQATSQPYQAQSKPIYISSQPYQVTSQPYQAQSESSHNTSQPYKVTSISQPFESNEPLASRQMDLNKTSDRISQPFLSVNDTFNITSNEASMGSSETTTLSNQSTFGDYDELISEPSHFKYFPNTKKSTGYKKPDSGSTVPKSTITSQPNYNHQQKSDMCLLSNKPHDFPGDFPPPTSKSDSVFDYDDVSSEYNHRTVTTLFQPVYSAPYPVTKEYSRITSESFRMMDPIKSQSSYNASYSVAEEYHHVSSIPDQVTTKPQPLYSVPYSRTRGYNTATSQSLPVTSDYLDRKNVFKSYVPNSFVPVVSHKESVTTEVNHTTNDTYPLSTTNLSVTEPQLIASLSDNVTKLKPENGPNYQTERSHLGRSMFKSPIDSPIRPYYTLPSSNKLIFSPSIYSTPRRNKFSPEVQSRPYHTQSLDPIWHPKPHVPEYEEIDATKIKSFQTNIQMTNDQKQKSDETSFQNEDYDNFSDTKKLDDKTMFDGIPVSSGKNPWYKGNVWKRYHEDLKICRSQETQRPPDARDHIPQEAGNLSSQEGRGYQGFPLVMTSCVPQVNHEVKHEGVNHYNFSRDSSFSGSTTQQPAAMSTLRDMIHRSHDQTEDEHQVLDLVYITERIISMSFPSEGHEASYRYNLKEVMNMLKTKHGDNCLILNISEPRQDLISFNPQRVIEYCWPDHLAPPLERLCNICKSMDSWLNSDPNHVVVIHCKGGRSRLAVVIAAYMHYCSICASADQALDRFAMKRFYDDKLGGLAIPSHKRYVQYFAGLLSGAIKINSSPLYLHHLVIHGVPNFDTRGGCRPFIKVYQGMQAIFTSGVYNVTDQMQKVCISISPGIPLRGDVLIKCYHKKAKTGQREVMWRCQFHTCAISGLDVTFGKSDLDDALIDPRFPDSGKVEFVFGTSQDARVLVTDFKSDVTVPVDDGTDNLVRWDSYEKIANADGTINGMMGSSMSPHGMNDSIQQSYSSMNTSKSSYSSSLPKHSVKPLDEQTQLDVILSDLLNDQVFVTSPQSPPKSGASTLTKDSRTFRTYDSKVSPDGKTTYQSAEVTYKMPGGYHEERNYTMTSKSTSDEGKFVPAGAFSYTTSPELARKSESQRTNTLPYRTDYDNRYHSESSYNYRTLDGQHSLSDSDQTSSWLQQQQSKLRQRKDSKDDKRVEQEKKLVEELRSAQNKYYTKRAQNEAEEHAVMESYKMSPPPPPLSNGPISPSYPGGYNTGDSKTFNTQTIRTESRSYGANAANKPPPSPGQTRVILTPGGPPVVPPVRTSSKDFMQQRSRTGSTNTSWQTTSSQGKQLTRQLSDTTHDRDQPQPLVKTITITTTPPHSPRPFSPQSQQKSYSTSSYTYNTSQQRSKDDLDFRSTLPRHSPTKTKVTEVQEMSYPEGPKKTHYITEVYVHRSAGGDRSGAGTIDRTEKKETLERDRSRLEELEKSLQAAQNSIIATQPQWQTQQIAGNTADFKEQTVTRRVETRRYETNYQQQQQQQHQVNQVQTPAVPPKQISVVEEDRFSLRPIGPGVQPLEPEGGSQSGTLGRATTPSFPVSPVASADVFDFRDYTSSSAVTSPTGTLTSQHSQFQNQQLQQQQTQQQHQYQTQQHEYRTQQYNTQQYGTEGRTHHGEALQIDTSPRMLSPGSTMTRSPPSVGSPPSPGSLNTLRQQLNVAHGMSSSGGAMSPGPHSMTGQSSPSVYFGMSRRGSLSSIADSVEVHTTPRFVKDTSKFWYKPNITREEAIQLLKDRAPGTFVVRDSNSFPGAFGLALKVSQIPPNVQTKSTGDPSADLVRHFLIEPTPKGVRLRGCSNEPVFGSLASLVYQHSITPLALPCKLVLPEADQVVGMDTTDSTMSTSEVPSSAAALLAQGAACNVLYLNSIDTESLTGPQAVSRAVKMTLESQQPKTTVVHFKVSNQGITLTDNQRKLFFRRHYPVSAVTYCGMDPEQRKFRRDADGAVVEARMFGFVARKQGGVSDNACHLFAELDPEQPASAIVNFVTKIMIGQSKIKLKS